MPRARRPASNESGDGGATANDKSRRFGALREHRHMCPWVNRAPDGADDAVGWETCLRAVKARRQHERASLDDVAAARSLLFPNASAASASGASASGAAPARPVTSET